MSRTDRLNSELKKEIHEIISRRLNDPEITEMVSVMKVDVSRDLSYAKVFVSDDIKAVVGTINLDYRSLYHHFECATYLYRADCIPTIEEDFQATLAQCREVTLQTIKKEKTSVKLMGALLKAVSPLM